MLVKEYRIPMPLDVEEYKIAQLYMIAKKSRLESEGDQSGVEILINEPYNDGPGGQGQYTEKIYYITAHLPYWLRGFVPKSLSTLKEEAWNAYPYSKNKVFTPNLDKFSLEIESKYLYGGADQDNVFELSSEQVQQRTVDTVNFVSEKLSGKDYLENEDPTLFKSEKTSRGPLSDDWLNKTETEISNLSSEAAKKRLMCVYKIVSVKFEQWPIQGRIEQYIHDYIRKQLIRAHRQAWAWQDEWIGLDMMDVRKMEAETKEILAAKIKESQKNQQ